MQLYEFLKLYYKNGVDDIEDAETNICNLFCDGLADLHHRLTGKPLTMGDGETIEEGISMTLHHFEKSIQDLLKQESTQ